MGKEHSQLTGRVARIYRWKNGRFMYIKLYSGMLQEKMIAYKYGLHNTFFVEVGNRLAGKYNNHVHMTFQNCVLKWEVSPEVDMPKNSSRYLIKQGLDTHLFCECVWRNMLKTSVFLNLHSLTLVAHTNQFFIILDVLCQMTICLIIRIHITTSQSFFASRCLKP